LLEPSGRLAVIVPGRAVGTYWELAQTYGFHIRRRVAVAARQDQFPSRELLEFDRFANRPCDCQTLEVYSQPGVYGEAFWRLTENFYLAETAARPASAATPFSIVD
jgi:tRNA1(Val) A37 N6-methylase TrmN6